MIVNTKFWSQLPSEIRSALESAMKDATQFGSNEIARKENTDAMAADREVGTHQDRHASDRPINGPRGSRC